MTGTDLDPRLAARHVIRNLYITIRQMSKTIHGMNTSLKVRISCSYNWCAVLMLHRIKMCCRVCSATAAHTQTGSLIFILPSYNLTLELLAFPLQENCSTFQILRSGRGLINSFQLSLPRKSNATGNQSVTCNKILPSPGSSYFAPAKLLTGSLKIIIFSSKV